MNCVKHFYLNWFVVLSIGHTTPSPLPRIFFIHTSNRRWVNFLGWVNLTNIATGGMFCKVHLMQTFR